MSYDWSDPSDEQEDYSACAHRFERMLKTHGHEFFDEDEFLFLIDHYMTLNKLEMAEKAIQEAMERYGESVSVKLRSIGLLIAREKTGKALKALLQLEKEYPTVDGISLYAEAVLYLELQELDKAEKKFKAVLQLPTSEREVVLEDPNFFNDLSDLHEERGDIIQALLAKQKAIRRKAAEAHELSFLTCRLEENGQLPMAESLWEARTETSPLSGVDWLCLGKIRCEAGKYEKAREAFHNVQALCGEDSDATPELAALQALEGHIRESEQELERYFSLHEKGESEQLRCYSQICRYAFDARQYQTCIHFCQKAIDLQGTDPYCHTLLALAYGECREYGKSVEVMRKLLRLDTNNFNNWLMMGEFLMNLDRMDEAGQAFQEARALAPEQENVQLAYAYYLHRIGQDNLAIGLLVQAYAEYGMPSVAYRLSHLYFHIGNTVDGNYYLRTAYASDPEGLEEFLRYEGEMMDYPDVLAFLEEINHSKD